MLKEGGTNRRRKTGVYHTTQRGKKPPRTKGEKGEKIERKEGVKRRFLHPPPPAGHARAKKNQQVSVIDVGSSFLFLHDFFLLLREWG